jgi:hypothetical protein
MPVTEMIVMVTAFSALALSFIHLVRLVGTAVMHRTIRRAVEVSPQTAEPLLARLGKPGGAKMDDDRLSVLLISFGIAMVAASLVIGDPGWMHYGVAGALFPLIVGTGLWLRVFFIARAQRRDAGK